MRRSALPILAVLGCNVTPTGSFGGVGNSSTDSSSATTSTSTAGTTETTTDTETSTTEDPPTTSTSTTDAATTTSTSTTDATATGGSTGVPADCAPLLFQAVVRTQGTDDNLEWIQLVNPCEDPVNLEGYALGWGQTDYTSGTLDLSGQLAAGACHIVGGPNSNASNGNPDIDQPVDLDPDLRNDLGIGLFDVAAGNIMVATLPVDALIYGSVMTGHLDPDGNTPAPYVGTHDHGDAAIRQDGGPNWALGAIDSSACAAFTP